MPIVKPNTSYDSFSPQEALATPADVAAGWRALTVDEDARVGVLLARASAVLRAMAPGLDARLQAGTLSRDLVVEALCASVVDRVQSRTDGVEAQTSTTGPFSQTIRWGESSGGFRFPVELLELIRSRRSGVRSVRMVRSW